MTATGDQEVFVDPRARELFDYWCSLSGSANAPQRTGFDPARVKALLPFIIMLKPLPEDDFQIVLFGTELRERFGYELTKEGAFDRLNDKERRKLQQILLPVLDGRCGFITQRAFRQSGGRRWIVQGMSLPLAEADGSVGRILAAFFPLTDVSHALPQPGEERPVDATYLIAAHRYLIADGRFAAVDLP